MLQVTMKAAGRTVAEARKARRESQSDVALRLGVSQQVISRVESGQSGLRQLVRVCRGLGVAVSLRVGEETIPLVAPVDPAERQEIEANIAWFSRLSPLARLRAIDAHARSARRLAEAARRGA